MPRHLVINFATNSHKPSCPHITYKTTGKGKTIASVNILLDINSHHFPQEVQQHLITLLNFHKRSSTTFSPYRLHIDTKMTTPIQDFYNHRAILTNHLSSLELSLPNHHPLGNLLHISNLPCLKKLQLQCYSQESKRLFIHQLPQLQILEIKQEEVATKIILDYRLSFTLIKLHYRCYHYVPANNLVAFDQPTKVNWYKLIEFTYKNYGIHSDSAIINGLFSGQYSNTHLRHLDLLVSNEHLHLPKLPNLKYLSIASIKQVNGLIDALSSLSHLNLSCVENLDDLRLICPHLTKLYLTRLPIKQCRLDCPSLKYARINYCRDLVDLLILQAECLDLELYGCYELATFDVLPVNCLRTLCVHRSHINCLNILQRQQKLRKLRLDYIPLSPLLKLQSSPLEELFIDTDTKDNRGLMMIHLSDMPELRKVCFMDLYQLQELHIYNAPQLTICSLFDCPKLTTVYIQNTPQLFDFDIRYAGCTIRQARVELHTVQN